MSVEQSIERLGQYHEAVMWWEPDEKAIVYAGSEVEEPVVSTEYTKEDADELRRQTGDHFFDQKIKIFDERERNNESSIGVFDHDPQPIGVLAGPGLVSGVVPLSTMEWLGRSENESWQTLALGALTKVRECLTKDVYEEWGVYVSDDMSGVAALDIDDVPSGRSLVVPNLVVNPVGCSCIGPEGSDRTWQRASLYGALDLHQHNVDNYRDSMPIVAGLAAINSQILGVESSQQTLF